YVTSSGTSEGSSSTGVTTSEITSTASTTPETTAPSSSPSTSEETTSTEPSTTITTSETTSSSTEYVTSSGTSEVSTSTGATTSEITSTASTTPETTEYVTSSGTSEGSTSPGATTSEITSTASTTPETTATSSSPSTSEETTSTEPSTTITTSEATSSSTEYVTSSGTSEGSTSTGTTTSELTSTSSITPETTGSTSTGATTSELTSTASTTPETTAPSSSSSTSEETTSTEPSTTITTSETTSSSTEYVTSSGTSEGSTSTGATTSELNSTASTIPETTEYVTSSGTSEGSTSTGPTTSEITSTASTTPETTATSSSPSTSGASSSTEPSTTTSETTSSSTGSVTSSGTSEGSTSRGAATSKITSTAFTTPETTAPSSSPSTSEETTSTKPSTTITTSETTSSSTVTSSSPTTSEESTSTEPSTTVTTSSSTEYVTSPGTSEGKTSTKVTSIATTSTASTTPEPTATSSSPSTSEESTSTEPSTSVTTSASTVVRNITTSSAPTRSTSFSQEFSTLSSTIETSTLSSTIIISTQTLSTSRSTMVTTTSPCREFTDQDLGNVTAENVGNRTFTLKWSDQTLELCGNYSIEKSPGDGSFLCTFNFSNNVCDFVELSPGQTYTLNIHFIDKDNKILTRTLSVTTVPAFVSNVTFPSNGIRNTSLTVTWSAAKGHLLSYIVQLTSQFNEEQKIDVQSSQTLSVVFSDLQPGRTYTITVITVTNGHLTNKGVTVVQNTDSDECSNGENQCDQVCIERNKFEDSRGYECSCESGFKLDSDGRKCTAIDICTLSCTNGKCFIDTSSNQPACQCNRGYAVDDSGSICRDVNECSLSSNNCKQTCQNTVGSFKCSCQSGYLLDQGDRASCHDINECESEFNNCDQICRNTPGSYKCSCNSGYVLDQRDKASCHDVDECLSSPCNRKGSCINTQGSYYCDCVTGWTGMSCSEDVNECFSNPCMNGTCLNTRGSYQCQCFSGFTGRHCETNINECSSQPCKNEATCIDSINAFACNCVPGYTGQLCQRVIDNCVSGPCKHRGFCLNRINDFKCICDDNWEGKDCSQDVDECSRNKHDCDRNAGLCTNTLGSYTCSCKEGYEGNGFICKEKRLFDYGSNVGDTRLYGSTRDFNSPIISIPSGFPFDDAFYYRLYFSDNGLIIFQRNIEYLQYTYSSPFWAFRSYFYGVPPMIAVFWDDADLRRGIGSIYYQVFDFQVRTDSFSRNFQDDIKTRVNSSYGSELESVTFMPKWALKITWENVLPFSGYVNSDSRATNTYQAVLTTDGIFSFCLIQFKDGGMNWQYYLRPYYRNYALMGYYSGSTSSNVDSNNFPAFNDPHTRFFVSPSKIYHPDQYPGFKTGKKGLWAYRLERNTRFTKNPRQKCFDWYIREPFPFWSFFTSPCPCSFFQAIFDRAYTWGGEIYYYGFDIKQPQVFYITMQSRFPNWLGSGVRCYYARNGGLIYGEKERFLPTPWTYYNWLFWWWRGYLFYRQQLNYFYNTVLPNLQNQYREMEVDPYNDCCRDSGDVFFCNLYRSKRPFDFCFGYIPPRIGFFFGDPHIVTLDSVKYTFNGLGEFILLSVKDENGTSLFRLQGRTLRAGENRTSQATSFVALAAQRMNGTKVQWNINDDDEIILMVDGNIVTATENSTFINEVTIQKTTDNETVAAFEGGTSITVSGTKGTLAFTTSLDNSLKNETEGLLGVWNDDKADDFKAANGTHLDFDGTNLPSDAQIFFDFGLTWKTTVNNSIFTYNTTTGESWYKYNNNSFVPLFYDELLQTTEKEKIDKANETCKGDDDCIFDVLSTDDLSFGAVTLQSVTTFAAQNSTMNNFPPNITGDSTIQTRLDEPVFILFTATDSNDDEVTFSVVTDSPDITITENGNFSWNPTSSIPVFAIIQANDSKAVSVLGLTLVLCNCSINSTCDYSRTILTLENNSTVFKVPACNCTAAYTGDYCTEDFDACQDNQCFLNDTCKDQPAPLEGYTCDPCPDNLEGDGIKCFDLDECQENTDNCEQICTNVFGGFNCSCSTGYTINAMNSSMCADIDECSNSSTCPQNADCFNLLGNYSCVCKSGFDGDPFRFCFDVDECLKSNTCASKDSICTNTEGSFNCTCLEGYEGTNCTDIDECAENQNNCPLNSVCNNTAGSFTCQCKEGYESPNCTDIDECTRFLFDCPSHAGCENIPGSFTCSCLPGFKGNATFCEDIDECAEEMALCPSNEICENSIGNYTCVCPAGSERVNGSCQDIDECQNPAVCSNSGQHCVNTEYSFRCECKSGFMNINGTCEDINECLNAEENNCSKTLGICANLEGSFACQCKGGYAGNGVTCNDTDECAESNTCSVKNNTMCVNTVGSYNCTCQSGYDGINCTGEGWNYVQACALENIYDVSYC
ncbi:hypothetical protein chiPu_0020337, partial [Chiloscyllium punctatum]|nr:hypothetical protein [Chiloscyllium punctatum]